MVKRNKTRYIYIRGLVVVGGGSGSSVMGGGGRWGAGIVNRVTYHRDFTVLNKIDVFKFLSCMFRLLRFRTALKVQEISALNSAKLTTAAYLMDENLSGCHIYQVRELILIE